MENTFFTELSASIALIAVFGAGFLFRHYAFRWNPQAKAARLQAKIKTQQLKATVSASLDGIIIINADGDILEFSEAAEHIFGYQRNTVLGKKMSELIVPERYRNAHNAGMERMRKTGEAKILGQRIEIEALKANGDEFISELAISRSQGDHGDIFIAFIRDISKQKASEAALKEAKEKAEDANAVKSKFLASMSHEIRTPFNAVLGILELLQDTQLSSDQLDLIQTATNSSHALLRIINDTLDYAKISSGKFDLMNTPFHPIKIFDDIQALFEPVIKEKGLQFELKSSANEELILEGDKGRISQILMNFISNAIKFTKTGTIKLIVKADLKPDGQYDFYCAVEDKGMGISTNHQSSLFEEFYMIDDTDTREHEGTGLGLAICKSLTDAMGGEIGVKSNLGEGALFWISIPLHSTEKIGTPNTTNESLELPDISGLKVLLAEDNKTNQMVVSRMLKDSHIHLDIVNNGQDVLDTLTSKSYDVIIMDISMPIMGGLQATKAIRQNDNAYQDIPIVAFTAMASADEIQSFKASGMDAVLVKPVGKRHLIHTLAKISNLEVSPNQHIADRRIISDLLDDITQEDLDVFKKQFHTDLSEALNSLHTALDTSDIELAQRATHIIKGLAATYGITKLNKFAALTNQHCKSRPNDKWLTHGQLATDIGRDTLANIDAIFSTVEVAPATRKVS